MKWTKEVLRQVEKLSIQGKSNKEIAEMIGTKTEYVRDARSRYGLTNAKLKGATESKGCFAEVSTEIKGAKGRKGCTALIEKNCTDCSFFKTVEQKLIDDEKTTLRLESLKDKAINIYY